MIKPKESLIQISSFFVEDINKLIIAKYDDIKKKWNVLLNINGEEQLTDLNKALYELNKLDSFGIEISEKITMLIDASKKIFNKSLENNRIK